MEADDKPFACCFAGCNKVSSGLLLRIFLSARFITDAALLLKQASNAHNATPPCPRVLIDRFLL
jgi:hypothetical protein